MSRPLSRLLVAGVVVLSLAPAAIGGAAAQDVTLELKVVNTAGEPVGGAELNVTWESGRATETTTSDGRALVDVPENATVTVTVDHHTYLRNWPFVIPNASAGVVEIPVARSGSVGITVQGQTGPVEGASVVLIKNGRIVAAAETASDGTATTPEVERGTYGMRVLKPGYYRNYTEIDLDGQMEVTRQIRPGAVQLQFNVTDDHFAPAQGVQNATVRIEQVGTTLRTFEDGGVSVSVPVNRRYDVTITKPGYQSVSRQVNIAESGTIVNATIRRIPEISLTSANQRVVVGETTRVTVRNAYDEPVEGATVRRNDTNVGTTTAEGVLDVPIDREGNVTIRASFEGLVDTVTVTGIAPTTPTTTRPPTTTTQPPTTTTSGGGGPGFGLLAALVALVSLAWVVGRRGRNT